MHSLLDNYGAFACLVIPGGGVLAYFVLHGVGHLPIPEPRAELLAHTCITISYPNIYTKHGGFY